MTSLKTLFRILGLALLVMACEPHSDEIDYQPVSEFIVSPDSGNTTTVFQFDASTSLSSSLEDNPVFLRWDWDADGNWDKMYTTGGIYTHRFYQKGTYTVALQAATLLGRKDTSHITIVITQGYSAPHAVFHVSPDSANIFTEFTFDASDSKDDEDSINQLQFRWDFEGDIIWDTEFSSDPIAKFQYPDNAFYPVRLEVKDPQDMRGISTFNLEVTRLNDKIVPIMISECWPCTLEDTINFDASESYIMGDPGAQVSYSWDIFADNRWELESSSSPFFNYKIPFEGMHKVKLRVTDQDGLYMDTITEVEIFPLNTPPVVDLVLGNRYGNPSTRFYLHGRGSFDRETPYFDRELRWDLDDDGIWEEEHNDQYEVWTQYDQPGDYPVALQITDTQGKSTIAYDTIRVFQGNRTTDILEDKRGGSIPEYYGTVKIGNTWWTQSNARYTPAPGSNYLVDVYMGQTDSVYLFGNLYPYKALQDRNKPCPDGWRIPSLDDWNQLMEDLAPESNISDLLLGGSSELHILLTGQSDYGVYNGKGRMVNYYTSTLTTSRHPYLWYIDKLLKKNQSVIGSRMYNSPIRCVKDQ